MPKPWRLTTNRLTQAFQSPGRALRLGWRVLSCPGRLLSESQAGHWQALVFFDLKENFAATGAALLPAYWVCWRRPRDDEPILARAILTSIIDFIVWWGFLAGHVANNIMRFAA